MVNIRILIYWGIDSLLMQYWTLKNHILVLHLESDFIFHMVYSFSSSWVKFIFVKKLVPYRVSITTLTRDHSSSASLLEESMTFFPSPSNVELFCLLETKSTTWHSKKKKNPHHHVERMFPQIWKITCASKSIDKERCYLCYFEHRCCVSQKVHVENRSLSPVLSTDMLCIECNNKVTKWSWLLQRRPYFHK